MLLTILSGSLISIAMRMSTGRISSNISMVACNYLTCILISGVLMGFENVFPEESGVRQTIGMGAINGFLYMASLLLMQYNIKKSGVVLPTIFSKLGLLVPIVVAMLFFKEIPTGGQVIGFVISVLAIIWINYEKDAASSGFKLILLLQLILDGFASAMSKIFGEVGNSVLSDQFVFYTFLAALVFCIAVMIYKKERPGKAELFFGVLIGIPNFFSARLVLKALETVPAVVVYPTRGVGTILVILLAGIFLFKERLTKRQWCAMAAILVALVLLNL